MFFLFSFYRLYAFTNLIMGVERPIRNLTPECFCQHVSIVKFWSCFLATAHASIIIMPIHYSPYHLPPIFMDFGNICGNRLSSHWHFELWRGKRRGRNEEVKCRVFPPNRESVVKPPPPNKLQRPTFRFHFNRRRRWRRLNLEKRTSERARETN